MSIPLVEIVYVRFSTFFLEFFFPGEKRNKLINYNCSKAPVTLLTVSFSVNLSGIKAVPVSFS